MLFDVRAEIKKSQLKNEMLFRAWRYDPRGAIRPNLRRKQQQQNSLSFYLVKWRSFWVGLD